MVMKKLMYWLLFTTVLLSACKKDSANPTAKEEKVPTVATPQNSEGVTERIDAEGNATAFEPKNTPTPPLKKSTIHVEQIVFPNTDNKNVVVKGVIIAKNKWLYNLDVKAGQTVNLNIEADNKNTTYRILSTEGKSLDNGSIDVAKAVQWKDKTNTNARYLIQLKLTPEAANAEERSNYQITVKLED